MNIVSQSKSSQEIPPLIITDKKSQVIIPMSESAMEIPSLKTNAKPGLRSKVY